MTTTDGVTDQTAPALIATLGGHYYTSAEVFAEDQSRIFETMWFCAARSGASANR